MAQVFEFTDYKSYLKKALGERGKVERGALSRLAEAMGCRPAYVTQVLRGNNHFSPEQSTAASQFFGHTEEETQFFLLLVLEGRGGNKRHRDVLARQIAQLHKRHASLDGRLQGTFREEDHAVFYSAWQFAAIFSMLQIPKLRTKEAIAAQLGLPIARVGEVMEQLTQMGLVRVEKGKFMAESLVTHFAGSPYLNRHHQNWRLKALQSIEKERPEDLHISAVVTLAEADFQKLRARLVSLIEIAINEIVVPSAPEKAATICLDLFGL